MGGLKIMINKQWAIGLTLAAVATLSGFAVGYKFGVKTKPYQNYEECILDLMPTVRTERGASLLRGVCDTKYQKTNPFDKFDPK